jgi:acyl carrier protein
VLPGYLVPATITALAALPLTGNGKVDHAALADAGAPPTVLAPSTPVEASLAGVWATVLGVERVGPSDNFFELGGTSLVAVRLLARLEAAYGVKIPLVRLYEAPTVAQLAAEIGEQTPVTAVTPRLTAAPEDRHEPFPLTPIQEAYWMGRRGGLQLGGVATHSYVELDVCELDVDRLEAAVQALVARHEALRTVVLPDGRQRVLPEVPAYRIARTDLRDVPVQQAQEILDDLRSHLSHQVRPADRWPLFEIRATRLDERHTRLHIGVDLLVADALSFRILQRELLARYADADAAPQPLGCTFRDYVLATERLRGSPAYRAARRYWTDRLPSLLPAPPLPLLRGPTEVSQPRFERLAANLGAVDWASLKRAAATRNLTPSALLCASFCDVLAMWSQRGRFTVNLTTFNRQPLHPDVDALVGDFTSTTLLAVDASAATFGARAGMLQQQIFQDLEHRHFSGVEVLRLLRADPARRAGATAPIVFTSMLETFPAGSGEAVSTWDAQPVYSVSQTPQVLLDHQVYEHDGDLMYTWDHVADVFPPGMVQAMFDAYGRLLRSLPADGAYWKVAPGWTP